MFRAILLVPILAVLIALFASTAALAQAPAPDADTIARARNHFNAGTAYYEDGRFEDAAREFAEAYRLTQHPDVLFNLASTYDRLEQRDEAIAHYQRYLAEAESPTDRDRIERRIRELETLRDAESRAAADREAASQAAAARSPDAGDVASDASADDNASLLGPIGWGVAGLGVAAGIVAVLTGVVAQLDFNKLSNACAEEAPHTCEGFDWQGTKREGETMATLNTVFLITSLAALAGGATMIVLDMTSGTGEDPDPTSARLEITSGPGLFGAAARLTF